MSSKCIFYGRQVKMQFHSTGLEAVWTNDTRKGLLKAAAKLQPFIQFAQGSFCKAEPHRTV